MMDGTEDNKGDSGIIEASSVSNLPMDDTVTTVIQEQPQVTAGDSKAVQKSTGNGSPRDFRSFVSSNKRLVIIAVLAVVIVAIVVIVVTVVAVVVTRNNTASKKSSSRSSSGHYGNSWPASVWQPMPMYVPGIDPIWLRVLEPAVSPPMPRFAPTVE